jgi:hypothetical protein
MTKCAGKGIPNVKAPFYLQILSILLNIVQCKDNHPLITCPHIPGIIIKLESEKKEKRPSLLCSNTENYLLSLGFNWKIHQYF